MRRAVLGEDGGWDQARDPWQRPLGSWNALAVNTFLSSELVAEASALSSYKYSHARSFHLEEV